MLLKRLARATALATSLVLVAGSAGAATLTFLDDTYDVTMVTDGTVKYGSYDVDMTSVHVDHGTRTLGIAALFTELVSDSWTYFNVKLDTNSDGVEDYEATWGKESGLAGVFYPSGDVVCAVDDTYEELGPDGGLVMMIPRSCLGNPSSVRVHVDVMWSGYNVLDNKLYFVDSAPGDFTDDPVSFSGPVASSNTGTVTSPEVPVPVTPTEPPPTPTPTTGPAPTAAPAPVPSATPRPTATPKPTSKPVVAARTSVAVKVSKKKHRSGSKPIKVTIRPRGTGNPRGVVVIRSNGKVVKTLSSRAGKKVTYKFPRKMKARSYKVKVTFIPDDTARWKRSTGSAKFKVTR